MDESETKAQDKWITKIANFIISLRKHMLWVLIESVSLYVVGTH